MIFDHTKAKTSGFLKKGWKSFYPIEALKGCVNRGVKQCFIAQSIGAAVGLNKFGVHGEDLFLVRIFICLPVP